MLSWFNFIFSLSVLFAEFDLNQHFTPYNHPKDATALRRQIPLKPADHLLLHRTMLMLSNSVYSDGMYFLEHWLEDKEAGEQSDVWQTEALFKVFSCRNDIVNSTQRSVHAVYQQQFCQNSTCILTGFLSFSKTHVPVVKQSSLNRSATWR